MNPRAVLLFSGGVESTVLLYDMLHQGYTVYPLIFDYGQRNRKELSVAQETCRRLNIIPKIIHLDILHELAPSALTRSCIAVPDFTPETIEENAEKTCVPNRNMVFLALATTYALSVHAEAVFIGIRECEYHDCCEGFFDAMAEAINQCDKTDILLAAPYLKKEKAEVVALGKSLNVDFHLTWSCFNRGMEHCGRCMTCVERKKAFDANGLDFR